MALQVKDLISSNVTAALDAATNPAKMLNKLQREIEEAILALEQEKGKASQRRVQLEALVTQGEMREADWGDKAKAAMDAGREDLARQALIAREDCRQQLARTRDDLARTDKELGELGEAIAELEVRREDTRERARAQQSADGLAKAGTVASPDAADRHLAKISGPERRTQFAADDNAAGSGTASVDREIEEMRRESAIEAQLAELRGDGQATARPAAAKPRAKSSRKRS